MTIPNSTPNTGTNALQQAAATTAAAITQQPAADGGGGGDVDYVKLLIVPDAAAPATTTTADAATTEPATTATTEQTEPAQATEPADDATDTNADTTADTVAATTATTEPAATAAPDPAIAAMQLELKTATTQLAQLLDKQASGQALTTKDQQQAAQAQRQIDKVREMMKAQDWDPLTVTPALAEAQKATDAEVVELRQKVAELEQRFGSQSQAAEQARVAAERAAVQQLYKGVDVDAVWNKSLADSAERLGLDATKVRPDSVEGGLLAKLANTTFHERAGQAAKSLAGRAAVTPAPAAAAAKGKTPVTPAGGRVQVAAPAVTNNGGTAALTPEQQYLQDAMALVKTN